MKRILAITLILTVLNVFSPHTVSAATPLKARDGSAEIKSWHYNSESEPWKEDRSLQAGIKEFAARYNIELSPMKGNGLYHLLHDVVLLDEEGAMVAQAPYPSQYKFLWGLSSEIIGEYSGHSPYQLPAAFFPKRAAPFKYTYLEGSQLITGRMPFTGEPYAIVSSDVVVRAQRFSGESLERAHELVAADLRVHADRLIVVQCGDYINNCLLALPGGKILVNDPSLVVEVISGILDSKEHLADLEIELLHELRDLYIEEHDELVDPHFQNLLHVRTIAPLEAAGLEVTRVAGTFKYSSRDGLRRLNVLTNFMSSVHGRDSVSGKHWFLSNHAFGLRSLERYWCGVLEAHSDIVCDDVHFLSDKGGDAGVVATGVLGI